MLRPLFPLLLLSTVELLYPPYPPNSGSHGWCFDSSRCPDGECCIPVTEPDGPLGRRGAAPPGRCFIDTLDPSLCMKTRSGRAISHWCNDGLDCSDDECCVEWLQVPDFGKGIPQYSGVCDKGIPQYSGVCDKGIPQYSGVCDKLGHYDSECHPDHFNDANNPRPDGLVKSCPCDEKFNCTQMDDFDNTKGICT